MNLDTSWDTLSYHLPFIARRMGFLTLEQYQMPQNLEDAFAGFPALVDYARGLLWWMFGKPEATNLLNLICLATLGLYVSRTYKVEFAWVLLALLAVPAVQTAVSTSYVDVSSNAIFLIFVLSLCDLWINTEKFSRPRPWIILVASASVAANFKLQIGLLVCFALPLVLPPIWKLLRKHKPQPATLALISLVATISLCLIGFNFLKNLIFYGNPIFPVRIQIGPWQLPGPYSSGDWGTLPYYPSAPQPVRWLLSILEFQSLGGRPLPYTNGMGDVPLQNPGARMGGYFAALVVISVGLLSLSMIHRRDRLSAVFLCAFIAISGMVSVIPGSHELRYLMSWMMFLVVASLIALKAPGLEDFRTAYKIAIVGSLVFVTSVTGGTYFMNYGAKAGALARSVAAPHLNKIVEKGDTICMDDWDPLTFLFAPIFHQELNSQRPYNVKQYGCQGYKRLPRG